MEIEFPVEFIVRGTPFSRRSWTAAARQEWTPTECHHNHTRVRNADYVYRQITLPEAA
jgi:hypothetical protein